MLLPVTLSQGTLWRGALRVLHINHIIKFSLLAMLPGKDIIPFILKVRNRCREVKKLAQRHIGEAWSHTQAVWLWLLVRAMLYLLLQRPCGMRQGKDTGLIFQMQNGGSER